MLDAHNHLHFEEFDDDREEVVDRAIAAGLSGMVLADYDSSRRELSANLASRPGIWTTAGLHPWALRELDDDGIDHELAGLRDLDWSPFCGLGELGLDRAIDVPWETQRRVFCEQLGLACDLNLPIVVHCVRANDELAAILEKEGVPGRGGMVHSFWGSTEQARRLVDLGLCLSIGTQLTKSQPDKMKQALNESGLDRLIIETDAPSRPPAQKDESRNEPGYLPCVVESLALVLGSEASAVAEVTEKNARAMFDLGDERLAPMEK